MSWDQAPPQKQELELLEVSQEGGWDQAPPSETELSGEQKTSQLASGIRQFNQGAKGNFSDEFAAGVEAAGHAMGLKNLGVGDIADLSLSEGGPTASWDSIKGAYQGALNQERGLMAKDLEDNPVTSTVANAGGAIASPINKLTKGMSLVKAGATYGGIQGLGASEEDDALGVARDGLAGAVVGGTVGKVVDKASPFVAKGAKKLGKSLRNTRDTMAARAVGAERGTIKKLGFDRVKKAGRFVLDNKNLSANADDMLKGNEAIKNKGGKLMEKAFTKIDDSGYRGFNPLKVASKLDDEMGGFYRSPINKGETNQLENTIESILMRGDDNISLREAQTLKQEIQKVANFKKGAHLEVTDKEKIARRAYSLISKEIDTVAEGAAKELKAPSLSKALKQGKKMFSQAKDAEMLLTNKQAREQGNKLIGLTDSITGGAALGYGATTGDWGTAVGIMAAKKGLGRYGPAAATKTLNIVSKSLRLTPNMQKVFSKNPKAFQALVSRFEGVAAKGSRSADKQKGPQRNSKEKQYALRGSNKWEMDGLQKLVDSDSSGVLEKSKNFEVALNTAKGRKLLIQASSAKSKAQMNKILKKLEALEAN